MSVIAAVNFVIRNPETGAVATFATGDAVPAWAERRVTNDALLADGEAASEPDGDEMPPTSGKGSGIEAWAAYAEAHDIEVPEGASRDDVIAAVEAASE